MREKRIKPWYKNRKFLTDLAMMLLGNVAIAFAIAAFVEQNHLTMGGATGIGFLVHTLTELPVSLFVMIFNAVAFVFGWIFLGKKFALSTAVTSFLYPMLLEVFNRVVTEPLTQDPLLATILGGLLFGMGAGLIIRSGASTGGTDIPVLILHKYTHISVSVLLYISDFLILMLLRRVYTWQEVLYGVLLIFIITTTLDRVMVVGVDRMQVKVMSRCPQEITAAIQSECDRGSTYIHARTGYAGKENDMVMTVVSNRELARVTALVQRIDPDAFVIVSKVAEVRGRGFTRAKFDDEPCKETSTNKADKP